MNIKLKNKAEQDVTLTYKNNIFTLTRQGQKNNDINTFYWFQKNELKKELAKCKLESKDLKKTKEDIDNMNIKVIKTLEEFEKIQENLNNYPKCVKFTIDVKDDDGDYIKAYDVMQITSVQDNLVVFDNEFFLNRATFDNLLKYGHVEECEANEGLTENFPKTITVTGNIVDENRQQIPMDTILEITYEDNIKVVFDNKYVVTRSNFQWYIDNDKIEVDGYDDITNEVVWTSTSTDKDYTYKNLNPFRIENKDKYVIIDTGNDMYYINGHNWTKDLTKATLYDKSKFDTEEKKDALKFDFRENVDVVLVGSIKESNITESYKDNFVIIRKDNGKYFSRSNYKVNWTDNLNFAYSYTPEEIEAAADMASKDANVDVEYKTVRSLMTTENTSNALLTNFDLNHLDQFEEFVYNDFIKNMSKEEALQVIINNVEGDFTQLSPKLAEVAEQLNGMNENNGWNVEDDNAYFVKGDEVTTGTGIKGFIQDVYLYDNYADVVITYNNGNVKPYVEQYDLDFLIKLNDDDDITEKIDYDKNTTTENINGQELKIQWNGYIENPDENEEWTIEVDGIDQNSKLYTGIGTFKNDGTHTGLLINVKNIKEQ